MLRIEANNPRNESQIAFVSDDCKNYQDMDGFYAAAVRLLWEGWDSDENTARYIANANKSMRNPDELQTVIGECLGITPIHGFLLDLLDLSEIYSMREDWNQREFVWRSSNNYWYMCWGTSA